MTPESERPSKSDEPAFMKIEGRLAAPLSPSDSHVFYRKRFPEPWMVAVGFVAAVAVLMIIGLLLGNYW